MDKKKKILIGAVLTVVILLAGVMAGFLFANAEKKESSPQNVENGALTNNERPVYDEKESTESPKNQEHRRSLRRAMHGNRTGGSTYSMS